LIQGRAHDAVKFFSEAIRLNPKNESARKGFAQAKGRMRADPINSKGYNGIPSQDRI
jgi:cytochrome c-type biogenesis protein CcmH/NrfG